MFSCEAISRPTQPPAIPDDQRKQSRKLQVTGRLKVALECMVWEGLKRDDAATKAGLTVHALYSALRKPHVKAEYLAQCEVLRTSGRARRIHRLEEISEATSNLNASVQAIRSLDAPDGGNSSIGSGTSAASPGVTIHIHAAPQAGPHPQPVRSDHAKPLITLDRDSLHENVAPDE